MLLQKKSLQITPDQIKQMQDLLSLGTPRLPQFAKKLESECSSREDLDVSGAADSMVQSECLAKELLIYQGGSACNHESVASMTGDMACAAQLLGAQPASHVINETASEKQQLFVHAPAWHRSSTAGIERPATN